MNFRKKGKLNFSELLNELGYRSVVMATSVFFVEENVLFIFGKLKFGKNSFSFFFFFLNEKKMREKKRCKILEYGIYYYFIQNLFFSRKVRLIIFYCLKYISLEKDSALIKVHDISADADISIFISVLNKM